MSKLLTLAKKHALYIALVFVLGIVCGGVFLLKKMNEDIGVLRGQIKAKYDEMKKYEKEKDKAPSAELITRLGQERDTWEKTFQVLLTKFSTSFPAPPTYKLYPAIEFKEFLYSTEEYLDKRAKKKRVSIPSSLGFPETGLPPADQIPLLSLKLEVVRKLLDLMIDAGVSVVNTVTPGEPKNEAFYKILPLQVAVTGTSIEIVRFLKFLENPSSFFIVESFSLRQSSEGVFSAEVAMNAVMLETQAPAPQAVAAPASTPAAPPPAPVPGRKKG